MLSLSKHSESFFSNLLGINGFFNQRGRGWGIVAVTLAINGLITMGHPLPVVVCLSLPASVVCGGIAFGRGARGLGGTAMVLGAIGFLLLIFVVITELIMFFS